MTKEQLRSLRRKISGWLTDQLNDLALQEEENCPFDQFKIHTRSAVLAALNELHQQLKEVDSKVIKKHHLKASESITCFYMKGGNAFRYTVQGDGKGTSDWDTQVLINPWLPQPAINTAYELIEDIIMTSFKLLSEEISQLHYVYLSQQRRDVDKTSLSEIIMQRWHDYSKTDEAKAKLLDDYKIKELSQQSIRKVYSHDASDLWLDTSQPMRDNKSGPGMIFNDAIRPFVLYRLGYVWRAETTNKVKEINAPILMEIIDVTIPRKSTIEAITLWSNQKQKITLEPVRLPNNAASVDLPFPDAMYHAKEQLIMLCEVADGTSNHADKMLKRFDRFAEVYTRFPEQQKSIETNIVKRLMQGFSVDIEKEKIIKTISMLGLSEDITVQLLNKYEKNPQNRYAYGLAVTLMDNVVQRSSQASPNNDDLTFINIARSSLDTLKTRLSNTSRGHVDIENAAYSDDQALISTIKETDVIDTTKVKLANIDVMLIVRTNSKEAINACVTEYAQILASQNETGISGFDIAEHNNNQDTRLSYASTIVAKGKLGKVRICVTFVSSLSGESPFIYPYKGDSVLYANLADMANQRRVAASLIQDYVTQKALENQVDVISGLVDV